MTSQRQAPQGLPTHDLSRLPIKRWARRKLFFRAAGKDPGSGQWRSPWWFCSCGDCRFDLPSGHVDGLGTLYAATTAVHALVEWLGPGLRLTVTTTILESRRIYALAYDKPFDLADLTSETAVGSGVTNQLSTMTPYAIPQAWALAISQTPGSGFLGRAFEGIAYWSRFNPDRHGLALAIFDAAGERRDYPDEGHQSCADPEFLDALELRGVAVVQRPSLRQLDILA